MALCIASLLLISMLSSGCMALSIQREVIESWRDPPVQIDKEVTAGWSETFDTGSTLDSVIYQNETEIVFDETVSQLTILFGARFPYSSTIEEVIGNDTNELRYVEARLWLPGTSADQGGDPFWEIRVTKDHPQENIDWYSDFIEGTWTLEVEARGYGVTAPIDQLSFHDHFDLYAIITKPCVRFPQTHEIGECTFLSELND
ncbi:MAG: hypothetical protein VYD50_02370 [Candidatus Thermoplasmatota archaeon]|nr:hypothetical protein [Candidatus Thermoplasmatota archaeon]